MLALLLAQLAVAAFPFRAHLFVRSLNHTGPDGEIAVLQGPIAHAQSVLAEVFQFPFHVCAATVATVPQVALTGIFLLTLSPEQVGAQRDDGLQEDRNRHECTRKIADRVRQLVAVGKQAPGRRPTARGGGKSNHGVLDLLQRTAPARRSEIRK